MPRRRSWPLRISCGRSSAPTPRSISTACASRTPSFEASGSASRRAFTSSPRTSGVTCGRHGGCGRRRNNPRTCRDGLSVAGGLDENDSMPRRAGYGDGAPYALAMFAAFGAAGLTIGIVALVNHARPVAATAGFYGTFFLANALSFFYTTRHGKFQVWSEVLDGLHLRGDEQVLDMGCGRGAVLIAAAKRLTTGRAVGIDQWRTVDQSGNSRDVTFRNASLEGVGDRIDIETGDMRALPFPDAAFDVVVSSLAIHNIHLNADRAKAVIEAWRVLKPGGRLAIADIRVTRRYAQTLRKLGASGVARRSLGWRFWYGNPFARTSLVTASKPDHVSDASRAESSTRTKDYRSDGAGEHSTPKS